MRATGQTGASGTASVGSNDGADAGGAPEESISFASDIGGSGEDTTTNDTSSEVMPTIVALPPPAMTPKKEEPNVQKV